MKKFLTTILSFVYLSASIGATVHLHYCMGKLVSWGLSEDADKKNCGFCGMPKNGPNSLCETAKKGCCKDEHTQLKTDKDQKAGEFTFQLLKLLPGFTEINFSIYPVIFTSSQIVEYPTANSPPFNRKVPVFIRNCNFRI